MTRVALDGEEAPRRALAVIGHAHGGLQQAQEGGLVRAGFTQLPRWDRAAGIESGQGGRQLSKGLLGHGSQIWCFGRKLTNFDTILRRASKYAPRVVPGGRLQNGEEVGNG